MSGVVPSIDANISREQYDRIERVNWSTLKSMGRSPAHYRHSLTNRMKDTDALRFGRVVSLAAFEPERFASVVAVWSGGVRRGKAWDAFVLKNDGMELVTEEEYERALAVAQAARMHPAAAKYLNGGSAEATIQWVDSDTGVECKGRLDFAANVGAISDLKTCRDASPSAFGRAVHNFGYLGQAAFYLDGVKAITGKDLPYVLIPVEKDPPHIVQPYVVPAEFVQLGREQYKAYLLQLVECRRTNSWPGYSSGEMDLQLPSWAVPQDDEEGIDGLDINLSQGAA